jgi:hypothetical protein
MRFCQALLDISIAAVVPKDSMTGTPLCIGLAVAARKEVGGSGKGRSVVHRARGRVVAYETSTEQVCVGPFPSQGHQSCGTHSSDHLADSSTPRNKAKSLCTSADGSRTQVQSSAGRFARLYGMAAHLRQHHQPGGNGLVYSMCVHSRMRLMWSLFCAHGYTVHAFWLA